MNKVARTRRRAKTRLPMGTRRRGGGDAVRWDEEDEIPLAMLVGKPGRREALGENLRALFKSFVKPPGQGGSEPSYFHGYYMPYPGDSFPDILLKALLATYDPGVPKNPYRTSLRRFLRTHLPDCFRSKRWLPRRPGPRSRLSLPEQAQVRAAGQALLALCKVNGLTPSGAYRTLVQFFPKRLAANTERWGKLAEISNASISDFHKARDTLACFLGVSRSTVDDLYVKFGKVERG